MDVDRESMAGHHLVARANVYNLLARALAAPATWDDALVEGLRAHFLPLGEEFHRLAQQVAAEMESALADRERADLAFAKLFLGPFEVDAPPYASLYLDPEHRLMGPVSLAVAEAYAEAGLGPVAEGARDAPDHITHELEFMYFVAFQSAHTAEPIWIERGVRFWRTHLGAWLPQLATSIEDSGRHSFYDALGALLREFASSEASAFESLGIPGSPAKDQLTREDQP